MEDAEIVSLYSSKYNAELAKGVTPNYLGIAREVYAKASGSLSLNASDSKVVFDSILCAVKENCGERYVRSTRETLEKLARAS